MKKTAKHLFYLSFFWFFFALTCFLLFTPSEQIPDQIEQLFIFKHIDKVGHAGLFFSLMVLSQRAFYWSTKINVAILISFAIGSECLQPIFMREMSIFDFFADTLGITLYFLLKPWIKKYLPILTQKEQTTT